MTGAHDHDRELAEGRADDDWMPSELPYRSDLLASLAAIINHATSPQFQAALAARSGIELEPSAAFVIRHLGFRGAMRPSEVAAEVGTGRSNISKILNRLERRELVRRTVDPSDSRASLVELTQAGADAAQETFDVGDRMIRTLTSDWTEDELSMYEGLSARLSQAIRGYLPSDWPPITR